MDLPICPKCHSRVCPHQCAAAAIPPRQLDCVRLLAGGLSNKEIGEQLGISVNTVKHYLQAAYRSLEVTSRWEAGVWARAHAERCNA